MGATLTPKACPSRGFSINSALAAASQRRARAGAYHVPVALLPDFSPLQAAVLAPSRRRGHHEGSLGPRARRARQRLRGERAAAGGR